MIKAPSALDSVLKRGIAHDGPVNVGGLGAQRVKRVTETVAGVTTADKLIKKDAVISNAQPVTHAAVTHKSSIERTNADKQRDYRNAHSDEIREKNRARMANKRKASPIA